ncbi:hypothetical protein F4803DRAFT_573318 [Xylaria telfairii]|nr:hypothetical protein F4803DRAFT_573318 [Xylaria telfairii]
MPCDRPAPAVSGQSYLENEQRHSISFGFCPDPTDRTFNQDWAAVLMVKCSDVPRIMREGFHWGSDNVIKEEGYMDEDFTCAYIRYDGKRWAGTRHYFLKDLQQPLRWTGTIKVFALQPETLFRFNLGRLSSKTMQWAAAINKSGHRIYNWVYGVPKGSYNLVYDNMAMKGSWPWPRMNEEVID